MEHALGVGMGQPAQQVGGDVQRVAPGQVPPLPEVITERLALDQLHHQEAAGVALTVVDHPDAVGVGQACPRRRLEAEALVGVGLAGGRAAQQLDRHLGPGLLVDRAVHDAHPAMAQHRAHEVALAQGRADDGVGRLDRRGGGKAPQVVPTAGVAAQLGWGPDHGGIVPESPG